ncbi:MAG: aminoacyl-tRNA hydrolase [Actinomycetaceae bacterium]|nr:aminoacyl-tRNA hydrolase [Actinomycetaceae bacterium]
MFAIVGLGNPGAQYEKTRHNIGHMVIDELARRVGSQLSAHRATNTRNLAAFLGLPGQGERAILATCNSYMNVSGAPVSSLLKYYDVPPENLIVIHDDLDLPFATLKLKRGGGEGGHNGLKSISQSLGTRDYIRLRCGIGRPPGSQDPASFVLKPFAKAESSDVALMVVRGADAIEDVIMSGLEKAIMRLHSA